MMPPKRENTINAYKSQEQLIKKSDNLAEEKD